MSLCTDLLNDPLGVCFY